MKGNILRKGKKALSLFLACLMVLTSWVFVAPTKAEAATAGGYYVRIYWRCDNAGNGYGRDYDGFANKADGNCVGISLFYKDKNGTDDTEKEAYWNLRSGMVSEDNYTTTSQFIGFPTRIYLYNDHGTSLSGKAIAIIKEIQISADNDTWDTLWKGEISTDSTNAIKYAELDLDGNTSVSSNASVSEPEIDKWDLPHPNSIGVTGKDSLTIPKTGEANLEEQYTATVYDQFGVAMYHDVDNYYVKSSEPMDYDSALNSNSSGCYINNDKEFVVTSAAQIEGSDDSKKVYITGTYKNSDSSIKIYGYKEVTLNDPEYTFTLNANEGHLSDTPQETIEQYGTAYGIEPEALRTGFEFKGFYETQYAPSYETPFYPVDGAGKLTSDTEVTADKTWYAAWQANLYTVTFNYRDDTGATHTYTENVYHGKMPTVPMTGDYEDGNLDVAFLGWSPAIPDKATGITSDITFNATYDGTFVTADYNAANIALEAASAILQDPVFEYKYNEQAKIDLSKAYNDINRTKYLGRTEQTRLDEMVDTLNGVLAFMSTDAALAEYDVIFMNGDELIDIVQVLYGKPVSEADIPSQEDFTKAPDSGNHYAVDGWDNPLTSITENILVYAKYDGTEHTFIDNGSVEANCVHGAGTEQICSCGYRNYVDTGAINPDKHENVVENTVIKPTCTQNGKAQRVCLDCLEILDDNIVIPMNGHSYQSKVTTSATCYSVGTRTLTCTDCDYVTTEEIPMLQHNFTAGTGTNDTAQATCTEGAYTMYYCNGGCGLSYKKYTAQKLDHSFGAWTYADNADGTKVIATGTCQHSGCNQTVNVEVANRNVTAIEIVTEPTCKTAGSATVTYTTGNTTTVDIPEISTAHAEYNTVYTAAKCGVAGSVVVTCKACNAEISRTEIAALNHSYSDWNVTTEATCTATGSKTRTCANCGDVQTEAISATGHKYVSVTGNCLTDTYRECACGDKITVSNASGHIFTGGQENLLIAATCTKDGYKTVKCTGCNALKVEAIAATGEHDYKVVYEKDADCHSVSYKLSMCTMCGDKKEEKGESTLEHDFVAVPEMSFPATCEGNGVTMTQCSLCGQYAQTIIDANGHVNSSVVTAPSCTTGGYTTETCSVCGKVVIKDIISATGHTTGNFITKKAATCTSDGYAEEICTADGCGVILSTKVLDKIPHSYPDTWTETPATCTQYGTKTKTCAYGCGSTIMEIINALGHNMVEGTPVDATCYSSAYTNYKCSRCEHNYNVYVGGTLADHAYTWTNSRSGDIINITGTCSTCSDVITFPITEAQRDVKSVELVTVATCTTEGVIKVTLSDDTSDTYNVGTKADIHSLTTTIIPAECEKAGKVTTTCAYGCGTQDKETALAALGHLYGEADVTQATCTVQGTAVFTCTRDCGKSITANIPVNENHLWGDWKVTKAATNTEKGEMERVCQTNSDHKQTVDIPEGGHAFDTENPTVDKAATCSETGSETYSCTAHTGKAACGVTVTVTTAKIQHTVGVKTSAAPTCTQEGSVIAYCTKCNIELGQAETISAFGHSWGEGVETKAPTCTADGEKTFTCDTCGEERTEVIGKLGHNMAAGAHVAPTCTTSGYTPYTCQNVADGEKCDHEYNVYDESNPATGHIYTNWTYADNADKTAVIASCVCDGCDKTISVTVSKREIQSIVVTAATCNAAGSVTITYTDGDIDIVEIEVDADAHNYISTYNAPTCATEGSILVKCSNCGNEIQNETLGKLAHTLEKIEGKAATCQATGLTDGYKCISCQQVIIAQQEIPLAEHSFIKTGSMAATCTSSGYDIYTCQTTDCGETYNKITTDPKAHDYKRLDSECESASCYKTGKEVYKCSACQARYEYTTPVTEHTYNESVSAATCTQPEITTYTCSVCPEGTEGHSYTEITAVATGHNYGSFTVNAYPTDTEDGSMTRTCSINSAHTETIVIPAMGGHIWNNGIETDEPSCTETGTMTFTCVRDNCPSCAKEGAEHATRTADIPATGHTQVLDYKAATCEDDGYARIVCSVATCKEVISEQTIPAKGHNYGNAQITKAATCQAEGEITLTCQSSGCFKTTTNLIAKDLNAHVYTSSTTEATCTEPSYTTYSCVCQNGGYTIKTGSPTGHLETVEVVKADATCTSDGYAEIQCKKCGAITQTRVLTKTGHAYPDTWTEIPATCTQYGTKTKTCAYGCGSTITEIINALGHNMVEGTPVDATCYSSAYTNYKCSRCEHNYNVYVGGTLADHAYTWTEPVRSGDEITVIGTCGTCSDELKVTISDKLRDVTAVVVDVYPTCAAVGSATVTFNDNSTKTVTLAVNENAHNLNTTFTQATCANAGSIDTQCLNGCSTFTATTQTIPALGHNYNATGEKVITATCNSEGKVEFACTRESCGEKLTVTTPENDNHAWGQWRLITSATDNTTGLMERTCVTCSETEQAIIPAGGHEYDLNGTPESSIEASCTQTGSATYVCTAHSNCGIKLTVTVPKEEHQLKLKAEPAPSCTQAGTVVAYCENCDTDFGAVYEIAALGHNYEKNGDEVAPDCVTNGSQSRKCSRCGDEKTQIIPATGHSYTAEHFDATCLTSGYTAYECGVCHDTYSEYHEDEPAKGHTFSNDTWSYEDNAEGTGVIATNTCSVSDCDATVSVTVNKRNVDSVEITSQPTCQAEGMAKITYTDGKTGVAVIPKNPEAHKLKTTTVSASCTSEGSVVTVCENSGCGYKHTVTLTKLQHVYNKVDADSKEATCTSSGYDVYKCDNCQSTYNVITDAPMAHDYQKLATSTEPDCTTAGHYYFKCATCTAAYDYALSATGHNYTGGVEVTQEQTCENEEITTYTCQTTGCTYSYTEITKAPLGHDWSDWEVTKVATEITDGKLTRICENDEDHVETITIPVTGGHIWNSGEVTTPATCTDTGVMTFTCIKENCDVCASDGVRATVTETIALKPHTVVVDNAVEADCENTGLTAGEHCSVCNTVLIQQKIVEAKGHRFTAQVTAHSTCSATGVITQTCSVCTHTQTTEIAINVNAHKYVETGTTEATCTQFGYTSYECEYCQSGYIIKTLPATGHSFGEWSTVAGASCTTAGSKERACSNGCGSKETQVISATGHSIITVNTVDPTCLTSGYFVKKCENEDCSYTYNEYSAELKATGHTFVTWTEVTPATESAEGVQKSVCSVDGCNAEQTAPIPMLGHNMIEDTTKYVAPTCNSVGSRTFKCENCNYSYDIELPMTAHAVETRVIAATCETTGSVITECTVDGCSYKLEEVVIEKLPHTIEVRVQSASCTEAGSVTAYCTACDKNIGQPVVIAALGHSFTDKVKEKAATCEDGGEITWKCSRCEETEDAVLLKLGHDMKAGEAVKATCTTSGYTPWTCQRTNCGYSYNEFNADASGHSYEWTYERNDDIITVTGTCDCGDAYSFKLEEELSKAKEISKVELTLAPTCVADGKITVTFVDGTTADYIVAKDADAHKLVTQVTGSVCGKDGLVVTTCENDGCDYREEKKVTASGHDFSVKLGEKDVTCETDGEVLWKCSRCDEQKKEVISKLGHDMKLIGTFAASCTKAGYTVWSCDRDGCDYGYSNITEQPAGHIWGEWKVTIPATETENGQQERACQVAGCGEKETAPVPKYGHDMVEGSRVEPTCTTSGLVTYVCKTHVGEYACGYTYTEEIPALGHSYEKTVTQPGCTEKGFTTYYCPSCGDTYISDYVDARGHDWGKGSVISDATCEADGEMYYVCKRDASHTKTETIPKLDHVDENGDRLCDICGGPVCEHNEAEAIVKIVYGPRATCLEDGYDTRITYCDECKFEFSREIIVNTALDHDFSGEPVRIVSATCTEDGYKIYECSRKGCYEKKTVIEENSAVGHEFILCPGYEPTCEKPGQSEHEQCLICGLATKPTAIAPTGHLDNNGDGNCDSCKLPLISEGICDCMCHSTSTFMEFIYKIISFFWKLFKIEQTCACGAVHY